MGSTNSAGDDGFISEFKKSFNDAYHGTKDARPAAAMPANESSGEVAVSGNPLISALGYATALAFALLVGGVSFVFFSGLTALILAGAAFWIWKSVVFPILGHVADAVHEERSAQEKAYHAALLGSDKKLALELGRQYYSGLRGGTLTIFDEQAIMNDISTMK